MFKFADIDGTAMSIEFRTASGNVIHIGLDGLSNTFFAEDTGTNIAGILTFENNNQVWDEDSTNELSMIRILRRNSLVSCYVNDFKIFENVDWMPGAISAIAWRPHRNTIYVNTLSLIKPFQARFRITFHVDSTTGMGTSKLEEIALLHGMFEF